MTEHDNPDAFETFKQAAEQFAQQVPLEYRDCNNERDYPAPSGHAPRLAEGGDCERGRDLCEKLHWLRSLLCRRGLFAVAKRRFHHRIQFGYAVPVARDDGGTIGGHLEKLP